MSRRNLVPDREIERVVACARKLGIPVVGLEVGTDTVKIRSPESRAENPYDKWKKAG